VHPSGSPRTAGISFLAKKSRSVRDEQALVGRPKKRPTQSGDDLLPDRTLEQRIAACEEETKGLRESLAALKEIAKTERRELETFRVDFKRGR
jgi:hypothetical protein